VGLPKTIIRNFKFAQNIFIWLILWFFFPLGPGSSQASDSVVYQSFEFGELRGRITHEAFVPISGEPAAGVTQSAVGILTGPFNTAEFHLVSLTGSVIKKINMNLSASGGSLSGFGEFTGSFLPPDQPFQVAVNGLDTSGNSYNLINPKVFTAQPLEVIVDRTTFDKAGNTSTLFVDITNHGNSGTFSIKASDIVIDIATEIPRGELTSFISRVSPSNLSLSAGATGGIEIDITPSSNAPIGTGTILTVEVAKTNNPSITNRDVVKVPVVLDTTPPRVTPPPNVTANSTGTLTEVDIGRANATDEVGVYSLSNNSNGFFPAGITEVTWVGLDEAGNLGTATQIVTVKGGNIATAPQIVTVQEENGAIAPQSKTLKPSTFSQSTLSSVNLLEDNFADGNFNGWSIVDLGTSKGPSAWSASSGSLVQKSNIYSFNGEDHVGTHAWYRDGTAWTDYEMSVTMRTEDNDGMGVVFRYQDSKNYYRFIWNQEKKYRKLVKVFNGVFTVVAEDSVVYNKGQTYQVKVRAVGDQLSVDVDGVTVLTATDSTFSKGSVGLDSIAQQGLTFDNVLVTSF
jgi:hypothetical protein